MFHPGWCGWLRAPLSIVLVANLAISATARADQPPPPEAPTGAPPPEAPTGAPPPEVPTSAPPPEAPTSAPPPEVPTSIEPSTAAAARRAPQLVASRTSKPPKIDGQLDDASWQGARVETNFTQNFPDEARPPTEKTEFRLLYDDDAIYIAIRCLDSRPDQILGRLTRRDRDIDSDKVTVAISSKNDKASAYHFQVNVAGVQLDGIRFNDTDMSTDWDGRWYSATSRDARGWTVELKIPLVTLRYNGDVSSFGFQVRRYLSRRGEIDEWSFIPRTAKGEVSYYGTIEGITDLRAKRLAEALVYDSRKFTFRNRQGAFDGIDQGGNLGADLKLGITPALTLDGTINPDFGTVETDQVVLNLSTVETYLREKRPFFLEGADLFATRFNLFYSRRVGATPPGPTLGAGAELREPLPDGRIWGALKLTGLVGDRLSIGALDAITSREDARVTRDASGQGEKLLVEPLSNFAVVRLRQDFGTNSSVGVLATAVNRFEPANAAAPLMGDLCPVPYSTTFTTLVAPPPRNGRCANDAYTAGIDTTLRTPDGEWGAGAQVVGSLIENGPTRLIPDGTEIGSGAKGWGINSEAGRYGGETWLFKVGYLNASPRLQINDAGFLDQANFHDAYASGTWRTTKPTRHLLSAALELYYEHRRDWALKDNLSTDLHVTATVQLPNLWTASALIGPYYPKWVDNRETQDGTRTQRTAGYYGVLSMKTDPNKPIVIELNSSFDKRLNDDQLTLRGSATLSLRPFPALELDLIPNGSWATGAPRFVTSELNPDGSTTYYFADLNAKSVDLTLRGTYAFTRKLTLQAYLQPFVASGRYSKAVQSVATGAKPLLTLDSFVDAALPVGTNPDFREGAINVNLFVRWEYLPLSALWLVYTRNQQQSGYDPMEGPTRLRLDRFSNGPTTDVILLKLSYLWF